MVTTWYRSVRWRTSGRSTTASLPQYIHPTRHKRFSTVSHSLPAPYQWHQPFVSLPPNRSVLKSSVGRDWCLWLKANYFLKFSAPGKSRLESPHFVLNSPPRLTLPVRLRRAFSHQPVLPACLYLSRKPSWVSRACRVHNRVWLASVDGDESELRAGPVAVVALVPDTECHCAEPNRWKPRLASNSTN